MTRITIDLIKRKSEHNDGIMGDLEEISLHQLEIEKIEVIGEACRKIKILYFQNNIISKIENLGLLKDLEYLNLALNNVSKIEGLRNCEFLKKLDLTVNFIDLENLEESVNNLKVNRHLQELFMIGNPAADWDGYRPYVITVLPQLSSLDGKSISRSERIRANQQYENFHSQLRKIAPFRARENKEKKIQRAKESKNGNVNDNETCEHTPEVRTAMYREMAEEKEAEDKKKEAMMPKKRDYEVEHQETVEEIRAKELAASKIMQCNQGKWDFYLREDEFNNIILELELSRHLSTSLIDADVQPTYVSVIIKNKVFRLEWPEEVNPDIGKAERSKTTGNLVLTMPKVSHKGRIFKAYNNREQASKTSTRSVGSNNNITTDLKNNLKNNQSKKLGEQMLKAAVDIRHITKQKMNTDDLIKEVSKVNTGSKDINTVENGEENNTFVDNEDVPPLE